jgi:hypothetical protein
MTKDRFDLLTVMRPSATLNTVWSVAEQDAALERILIQPRTPRTTKPDRPRWPALAAALVVGLFTAPGVATAVGSGMRPQAFFDAYDYWNDNPNGSVEPSTATRAATAPGPFGGTFSVLTARNTDGLTCIGPVFETSTSAAVQLPDDFEDGGSFCHAAPSTLPFGIDSVMYTDSATVWWAHAGDAVAGEVRMPSGEVYPVVRVEGYLFGWYPLPEPGQREDAVLTGFAPDGSVVGRIGL